MTNACARAERAVVDLDDTSTIVGIFVDALMCDNDENRRRCIMLFNCRYVGLFWRPDRLENGSNLGSDVMYVITRSFCLVVNHRNKRSPRL
jgi:hypothetical protein